MQRGFLRTRLNSISLSLLAAFMTHNHDFVTLTQRGNISILDGGCYHVWLAPVVSNERDRMESYDHSLLPFGIADAPHGV